MAFVALYSVADIIINIWRHVEIDDTTNATSANQNQEKLLHTYTKLYVHVKTKHSIF